MSDIWSGIGIEISKTEGEWLFRKGGEIHGPVSQRIVVDKLLRGEIEPDTPIAKEGGDFHPISRVKVFVPHLKEAAKLAKKRAAARVRRIVILGILLLLAGGAVGGHFVYQAYLKAQAAAEAKRKEALAELEKQRKLRRKAGDLELVAVVSFKEEEVTIRRSPRRTKKGKKPAVPGAGTGSGSEFAVASCERSPGAIVAALGKYAGKLSVCVGEERKRDQANLMPAKLNIEFVVTPDGRVVDFAITDRHYRTGILKNCMTKVFRTVHYPTAKGSNCPVSLPLNIGK